MILSFGRFVSTVAVLLVLGCSAASACDPGEVVCDNGHKYSCHCWSGPPCEFYPSGTCHDDDFSGPPAASFNLLMDKYVHQARLARRVANLTDALELHAGH
jgi:hypothetical protein